MCTTKYPLPDPLQKRLEKKVKKNRNIWVGPGLNKFEYPVSMLSTFQKAFKPPRSARECTAYMSLDGKSNPGGTVIHALTLNDVYCTER